MTDERRDDSGASDREGRDAARSRLSAVVQAAGGSWTGPRRRSRVAYVESAEHVAAARALTDDDGRVLSPAAVERDADVLHYEGSLAELGGELLVDDTLVVYVQDYLSTPFMAVAGPTLVRIASTEDYDAFLDDADLAREQGVFVDQLVYPGVFLADQWALAGEVPEQGTPRLWIASDGTVRTGADGAALGTVADDREHIEAAAAGATRCTCLAGIVPDATIGAARECRPWLPRYLRAVAVLRDLQAASKPGLRISGFGGRLNPGLPAGDDEGEAAAPLLLWDDEEHLLCDLDGERVFRLGREAARIAEILFVAPRAADGGDMAVQWTQDLLGLDQDQARTAVADVADRLVAAGLIPRAVVAA